MIQCNIYTVLIYLTTIYQLLRFHSIEWESCCES